MRADLLSAFDLLVDAGKKVHEIQLPGTDFSVDLLFLLKEFKALVTKGEDGMHVHLPSLRLAIPHVEQQRDVVPISKASKELSESEERVVNQILAWYGTILLPAAVKCVGTLRRLKEEDAPSVLQLSQAICERSMELRQRFQERRPMEVFGRLMDDEWFNVGVIGVGEVIELISLSGCQIPDDLLIGGFEKSLEEEGDDFSLYAYLMAHSFTKVVLDRESARGAWNRHGPKVLGMFRSVAGHCYDLHELPLHAKAAYLAIVEAPEDELEHELGSFEDVLREKTEALQSLARLSKGHGEYEDCLVYLRRLEDHYCAAPESLLSEEDYLGIVQAIYECRKKLSIPVPDHAMEQLHRLNSQHLELVARTKALEAQLTTLQDASVAKGKKIEAAVQSRFRASWTLLDPEVQGKLRLAEQLLQENGGTTAEGTDKVPFIVLATSLAVEIQLKVSVFSREVLRVISEPYRDGLRDFGMLIRRGQTGPPSLQRIKNPSALKDYVALIDFLAVWRNRAVHPSPGRTQADLDRFLSEVHGSKGISGLFETLTDWKQPH